MEKDFFEQINAMEEQDVLKINKVWILQAKIQTAILQELKELKELKEKISGAHNTKDLSGNKGGRRMAKLKLPIEFQIENKEDLDKAKETAAELVALLKEAKELIRSLSKEDNS